uniref:CARD domain-containing protein n=1 Tax=Plectus sambesii TaxID=2011161 RepID=A0A914WSJ9_9BILA
MNEQHRELIKKFQPQFIQAIVENQCLEWLINQLLSLDHGGDNGLIMQDLLWLEGGSYTNEAEKVRVLFKILSTRGRNGIDRFFKAIIDTKQATLISILTSQLPPNQQIENESSSDHSSAQVGSNIGIRSFDRNSGILVGHMQGGTQHNYSAQGSIYFGDISEQRFAFNSHNHDGRMVSGSVQGGTVVQGDYHYHLYQA